MNLYNLIFEMVILIPFLTQPPHERTLTGRGSRVYPKGRGSRVYPNVGAAGCGLVGAGGVLGLRPRGSGFALRPRGSFYEFVVYNYLYKKCTNCMNLYYTICIKNVRII